MVRKIFYWIATLGIIIPILLSFVWPGALYFLIFFVPYTLLGIWDMTRIHNIRRNYPVIGHLRYLFEFIRPEIQQYFINTNQSGRPFNREVRSLIYQRSKKENDTLPFGTQHDVFETGYEGAYHSLSPKEVDFSTTQLMVGGRHTAKPYKAYRLNISAMSFGAIGKNAVLAMNKGAKIGGFAHNTGEGGLSPYHLAGGGDIIWQVGTGYFGCRQKDGSFDPKQFQEKSQHPNVKMIELKLSQGAKPSHGGILPAAKITEEISKIRGVPMGEDCVSPPAHSLFASPKGLLATIVKLRELSGGKPVGFKLCIGYPKEFFGICKAMVETGIYPDFITVDGAEGGTGAAPVEFTNRLGTPINEAIALVHQTLIGCALRDKVRLIASGKVATGFEMVMKTALGADMCNAARAMMFAVGCIQALRCNTNTCPTGVTTQDPSRQKAIVVEEKKHRVANYQKATLESFLSLVGAMGLSHPDDLNASHVFRRNEKGLAVPYSVLYPQLQPGELLGKKSDFPYWTEWQGSASEAF